jgi:hypothetical protein
MMNEESNLSLRKKRRWEELEICEDDMTDDTALQFLENLSGNSIIKTLIIDRCNVNIDTIHLIAKLIKNNTTLERLDLTFSNIDSEQAAIIVASMENNISITMLSLVGNNIDDTHISEWKNTLNKNAVLEGLHLANNKISFEGVNTLICVLESNNSLIFLDLTCQSYTLMHATSRRLSYSLSAVANNFTIQKLCLSDHSYENILFLEEIYQRNRKLYGERRFNRTKLASTEEEINENSVPQKSETPQLKNNHNSLFNPRFPFASSIISAEQPQQPHAENNKRCVMI